MRNFFKQLLGFGGRFFRKFKPHFSRTRRRQTNIPSQQKLKPISVRNRILKSASYPRIKYRDAIKLRRELVKARIIANRNERWHTSLGLNTRDYSGGYIRNVIDRAELSATKPYANLKKIIKMVKKGVEPPTLDVLRLRDVPITDRIILMNELELEYRVKTDNGANFTEQEKFITAELLQDLREKVASNWLEYESYAEKDFYLGKYIRESVENFNKVEKSEIDPIKIHETIVGLVGRYFVDEL